MRPLRDEDLPATVWGRHLAKSFDPAGYCFERMLDAMAKVAPVYTERGKRADGRKWKLPDKDRVRVPWLTYGRLESFARDMWWKSQTERQRELNALTDFAWRAVLSPGAKEWLNMVWEARTRL
jgi:hypothetical protein